MHVSHFLNICIDQSENWCYNKLFLPYPRVKVTIVGSLRGREVTCSASDRQGSNFESCVWRTVSSQSSHHPQEVLRAQFSLYVHKGGLKPDSFHFFITSSNTHFPSIMYAHGQAPVDVRRLCLRVLMSILFLFIHFIYLFIRLHIHKFIQ